MVLSMGMFKGRLPPTRDEVHRMGLGKKKKNGKNLPPPPGLPPLPMPPAPGRPMPPMPAMPPMPPMPSMSPMQPMPPMPPMPSKGPHFFFNSYSHLMKILSGASILLLRLPQCMFLFTSYLKWMKILSGASIPPPVNISYSLLIQNE